MHNSRLRQVCMCLFIFLSSFLLIYFIFKLTGYEDLWKTLMGRLPLSLGYRTLCRFLGWECGILGALFFFSSIYFFGDAGIPEARNNMAPSGASGSSSSSSWTGVLGGILSNETTTEDTSSTSVNKPEGPPFPRANLVPEQAGPSNQTPPVIPFPYADDELIGGESVNSIHHRLLNALQAKKGDDLSLEDYRLTRYQAEDLFEVKASIIRRMAPLDPEGDWEALGAKALYNPRTATGEERLERLLVLDEDLNSFGVQSQAFKLLKDKVLRRRYSDAHSET